MTSHFAGKFVLGRLNDVVEAADLVTRVDGVLVELHFHFGEFINFCSKFLIKISDGVVEFSFLSSRGELELGEIFF